MFFSPHRHKTGKISSSQAQQSVGSTSFTSSPSRSYSVISPNSSQRSIGNTSHVLAGVYDDSYNQDSSYDMEDSIRVDDDKDSLWEEDHGDDKKLEENGGSVQFSWGDDNEETSKFFFPFFSLV